MCLENFPRECDGAGNLEWAGSAGQVCYDNTCRVLNDDDDNASFCLLTTPYVTNTYLIFMFPFLSVSLSLQLDIWQHGFANMTQRNLDRHIQKRCTYEMNAATAYMDRLGDFLSMAEGEG